MTPSTLVDIIEQHGVQKTKIRTEKQAKHLSKHDPTGKQWVIGEWYYLVMAEAPIKLKRQSENTSG